MSTVEGNISPPCAVLKTLRCLRPAAVHSSHRPARVSQSGPEGREGSGGGGEARMDLRETFNPVSPRTATSHTAAA